MSFNLSIDNSVLAEVEAFRVVVKEMLPSWKQATTLEERAGAETSIFNMFERFSNNELLPIVVNAGQHPTVQEWDETWFEYKVLLEQNLFKLRLLFDRYNNYMNSQQLQLMALDSKLRRIEQKKTALKLWSGRLSNSKGVFVEQFLNYILLGNDYITESSLAVDTDEGIMTLPIKDRKEVAVSRVRIGAGSNGRPGNSDTDVTTNTENVANILSTKTESWFEYETIDNPSLKLVLEFEFGRQAIVNHLSIEALKHNNLGGLNIEDIVFVGDTTQSIRELLPDLNRSQLIISDSRSEPWSLSFLPVKARKVLITVTQNQSSFIPVLSPDGRVVNRERYAIAINRVIFESIRYEATGSLNSVLQRTPVQAYSGTLRVHELSTTTPFYTKKLEVSTDAGTSFKEVYDNEIFFINEHSDHWLWRIKLSRENEAFSNYNSLLTRVFTNYRYDFIARNVNTASSPVILTLPPQSPHNAMWIYQPKIFRVGDPINKRYNSYAKDKNTSVINLPFSLLEKGIDPVDMKFRLHGELLLENPSTGYVFNNDYSAVTLGASTDFSTNSRLEIFLNAEKLFFEERSDGYYADFAQDFDPDKETIDIKYFGQKILREQRSLPKDRLVIPLGHKHLVVNSFELVGAAYQSVATRVELTGATDKYWLDRTNGVLYLSNVFTAGKQSAAFSYRESFRLSAEEYDVISIDGVPRGIRIAKDSFVASEFTETFDDAEADVIDPVLFDYSNRSTSIAADNIKVLSHKGVLPKSLKLSAQPFINTAEALEVPFIDGNIEFQGLVPMLVEETVETNTSNDYIEFMLSAGSLVSVDSGVFFNDATVFVQRVASRALAQSGSHGDYFVGSSGLVTVNVSNTSNLPGGISINYYYRDPGFEGSGKYSVDYKNGIVYAFDDFDEEAVFKYKTSLYQASYDMVLPIQGYRFDRSNFKLEFSTEKLSEINSLVKVAFLSKNVSTTTEDLKEFYTPLVDAIEVGFY